MAERQDAPRRGGHATAEVGALLGAAIMAVIAFAAFQVLVVGALFDDDGTLEAWAVTSTLALVAGAAGGCWFALRRGGHAAAGATALVLVAMLVAIFAVVWWSSNTALQSRLYPYGTGLAVLAPIAARALTARHGQRTSHRQGGQ